MDVLEGSQGMCIPLAGTRVTAQHFGDAHNCRSSAVPGRNRFEMLDQRDLFCMKHCLGRRKLFAILLN